MKLLNSDNPPKFTSIYTDQQLNIRFLKFLIVLLLGALFISFKSSQKPPIVIRESQLGISVVDNYEADSKVTQYDVQIFVEHFIRDLNLLDSYALQENLPKALNMMDSDLRSTYKSQILTQELLKKIVADKVKTKTTIRETKIDLQKELIPVTAIVEREVINYETGAQRKIIFRAELILKNIPRTQKNPYGLLTSQYKEIQLN